MSNDPSLDGFQFNSLTHDQRGGSKGSSDFVLKASEINFVD